MASFSLQDKSKYSSFICDFWFDMYLENRDPIALNVNPQVVHLIQCVHLHNTPTQLTFLDDPVAAKNTQLVRASNLLASSVKFFRTLRDEQLEPGASMRQIATGVTQWQTSTT